MKISIVKKMIKEAAIGFRPDPTSKGQSQVKLIMSNLEQALEYFQNNAFVKSFDEDTLATIMATSGEAVDQLNNMMQTIDGAPDSKKSKVGFSEDMDINDPILMKMRARRDAGAYEEEEEESFDDYLNRKWQDQDNQSELKDLIDQRDQLMIDMEQEAEPEGGSIADRYGTELEDLENQIANLSESVNSYIKKWNDKMKGSSISTAKDWVEGIKGISKEDKESILKGIKESVNEGLTQKQIDDIEKSGNIDIAYKKAMKLLKSLIKGSVNEDQESKVKENTMKALEAWYDTSKPTSPSLFDIGEISNMKMAHVQHILQTNNTAADAMEAMFRGIDEGTCGYSKDGKPKNKPAGPHLITKADLKERIKEIIKKHQ